VTATSTINSITLSWAAVAPPADGGSPVTGYRASCAVGSSGGSVDVAGGVTSATIPALAPGTNYSCRVRVSTQAGGRTTSTPINVPTQDVVPGTVSALGGAAGVRSVSLAWNPPAPNGGSAVQRYVVRLSACGGKQTLPTTTSVTLTGLSSRCTFTASVAARNRKGDGPAATATFTTPDAPPGAVRRLTASPGDGALTVSWSAPSTHGETHPSGYQVSIWYPGKVEYSNVVTTNRVVVKRLRPGARTKVSVTPLSPLGAGAATVVQVVPGVRLAPVGAVRQRVATGRTATIGVKIIVLQSLKPLKNDRIDVFLVGRGKPKLLGRIKTNAKGVAVFRFKVTKSAILLLRPTSKSVLGKRFTLLAA
jgi:titin